MKERKKCLKNSNSKQSKKKTRRSNVINNNIIIRMMMKDTTTCSGSSSYSIQQQTKQQHEKATATSFIKIAKKLLEEIDHKYTKISNQYPKYIKNIITVLTTISIIIFMVFIISIINNINIIIKIIIKHHYYNPQLIISLNFIMFSKHNENLLPILKILLQTSALNSDTYTLITKKPPSILPLSLTHTHTQTNKRELQFKKKLQ